MLEVLNQDQRREKHPSARPHRCGNAQTQNVKHKNWLSLKKKGVIFLFNTSQRKVKVVDHIPDFHFWDLQYSVKVLNFRLKSDTMVPSCDLS